MKTVTDFFTPIFYQDGNLLVIPSTAFMSDTESGAETIGALTAAQIAVLTGAKFTGVALQVTAGQRYVPARLGAAKVAVLSGPLFRRIAERSQTVLM